MKLSPKTVSWLAVAALLILVVPGCIIVRTTDHRIRLNKDHSGQAVLRLIDIRSDETRDSLVARDFNQMMVAFGKPGVEEFEQTGRKITSKQFFVRGDTLILEIQYSFQSLDAIEGLRVSDEGVFIVVGEGREIVRTDGSVKSWRNDAKRILWDSNTSRMQYIIRDSQVPPSVSLAALYRQWLSK